MSAVAKVGVEGSNPFARRASGQRLIPPGFAPEWVALELAAECS